jgi:hypothetical protein
MENERETGGATARTDHAAGGYDHPHLAALVGDYERVVAAGDLDGWGRGKLRPRPAGFGAGSERTGRP